MRYHEIIRESQSVTAPQYVYHATERENEQSIRAHGLRTGSLDLGHEAASYKDRVYVFSEFNKNGILDYMGEVLAKRHKRSINKSSMERDFYLVPYSVLKIDTSGLPNQWFVDTMSHTYCTCLYTTSPIPAEAIVDVVDREDTDHSPEFKQVNRAPKDDFPVYTNQTAEEIRNMEDGYHKLYLAFQYEQANGVNPLT